METKGWDILTREEQMRVEGGQWVVIDGEWYWVEEIGFENMENTF